MSREQGPSPAEIAAMMQSQAPTLNVAAPMNDVQLQCLMASYLLGASVSYYREMPKELLALEVFEITAQITSLAADPNAPKLRQRVVEIVNQRNSGNQPSPAAEQKSSLVLVKD